MPYNTLNPLGSDAFKDLSDNARNFDLFSNGPNPAYPNRFGQQKLSISGMNQQFNDAQAGRTAQFQSFLEASGYVYAGDYGAGITLTTRTQYLVRSGVLYRVAPSTTLPYTTTGTWASEQAKFLAFDTQDVLRQDLATNGGAGLVEFLASESYAVGTVGAALKVLTGRNVLAYGAKGDGATDDTAAIQAVLDLGGDVYFPATRNGYRISSTLTVSTSGVNIFGDGGSQSSFINLNGQISDVFKVTAPSDVEFRNLSAIDFAARGTSDVQMYFIRFEDTSKCKVLNCTTNNIHSGVMMGKDGSAGGGANSRIQGCNFLRLGAGTGVGIHYGGNAEIREASDCLIGGSGHTTDAANNALAGVRITGGVAIVLHNLELPGCGTPLLVQPVSGSQVVHTKISKVWCDSSSGVGMWLDGTLGRVLNLSTDQCWFSGNTAGIRISGYVHDVTIFNADIYQNRGTGIILDNYADVLGLEIGGGTRIGGNTAAGISVGINVSNFRITNSDIGASSHFGANQHGIYLNGGNENYDISHNSIFGNSGAQLFGHASGSATRIVKSNIGFTTEVEAAVNLTTDASGLATITHNMGATPSGLLGGVFGSTDARSLTWQVVSLSANTAVIHFFANNTSLASTGINFFFRAFR